MLGGGGGVVLLQTCSKMHYSEQNQAHNLCYTLHCNCSSLYQTGFEKNNRNLLLLILPKMIAWLGRYHLLLVSINIDMDSASIL